MATATPITSRETSESNAVKVGSYRRNGKLQSCEPCRKGKLRCDHTVPSCARCVRRGKPEQCIYHPAPLTKPRQSPASAPARTALPTSQREEHIPDYFVFGSQKTIISPPDSTEPSLRAERTSIYTPPSSIPVASTIPSLTDASLTRRNISAKDSKIGYLGTSSYSAVYTENAPNLGIDVQEGVERSTSPPVSVSPLPMEKVRAGAEVLSLLGDLRLYEMFMSRWFDIADGMMILQPIYEIWIQGIWSEFGNLLSTFKSSDDLYSLSELVWRNTLDSLPLDANTTGRKWAESGTGKNLRWETVGLIFSGVGILAGTLSDWDNVFTTTKDKIKDRPTLMRKMMDGMEDTIKLCRDCESTNELFACLLYESAVLLETMRGDTYFGAWTRLGETCDLLVLMGLHQEKKLNALTSFFICQLRIRMFAEVYGHEKAMATFLGRPPRLSHRYCVLQLPLDLADDEMLLEGPELEEVLSKLRDGWNTSNQFHRVTWRRVWARHARIREDILEIALGTGDHATTERGNEIMEEIVNHYETMPDFMKTSPEELLESVQVAGQIHQGVPGRRAERKILRILYILCMHCGLRHTEFLLRRALVNRGKAGPSELIPPARRLLSLILLIMAKRDYFRDFQVDLVCLLAFHGLPSAGVLAVELLKQEQSRQYTPEILPRSETIQDLSVFISALATVGPGEGNHAICNQGRRALKRLLDKILSPDPVPPKQPNTGALEQMDFGADMSGLYFPTGNDAEFLQWLEDVGTVGGGEWDRGSWLNPL